MCGQQLLDCRLCAIKCRLPGSYLHALSCQQRSETFDLPTGRDPDQGKPRSCRSVAEWSEAQAPTAFGRHGQIADAKTARSQMPATLTAVFREIDWGMRPVEIDRLAW